MRTRSTPALRALCQEAPGPGCLLPPWRGWTGWLDQVSAGGEESMVIKVQCVPGVRFTVEIRFSDHVCLGISESLCLETAPF